MKHFKHFTLLEIGSDAENPMIGTITNVVKADKKNFVKRFLEAVSQHFDIEDFNYTKIPDIFNNEPHYDIEIEADGLNYTVRILETWIY